MITGFKFKCTADAAYRNWPWNRWHWRGNCSCRICREKKTDEVQ